MNRTEQKWSPVIKGTIISINSSLTHLKARFGLSNKEASKTFAEAPAGDNFISRTTSLLSKNYIVHVGVIILALVVAGFNVYAKSNTETVSRDSSILFSLLGKQTSNIEVVTAESIKITTEDNSLLMASVLSASKNTTGTGQTIGINAKEDTDNAKQDKIAAVGGDMVVKTSPTTTQVSDKPRKEVTTYIVSDGDTVTSIANYFGIDVATILCENELYADSIVKSGDELTILPVSGKTERVDEGDTLDGIAAAHGVNVNDIVAFNELSGANDVQYASILVIPDADRAIPERPAPPPQDDRVVAVARDSAPAAAPAPSYNDTGKNVAPGGNANGFPYGWCTWYVASRKSVTWRGNAGEWLGNAAAQGYATGSVPAVGSIMVSAESWWGHVAYVESVNGNVITISEMNYAGWGVTSTRTIDITRFGALKGFIY